MKFLFFSLMNLFLTTPNFANPLIKVGLVPPTVTLSGEGGGILKNDEWTNWSSTELKGRLHIALYLTPSSKSLNEHVTDALEKKRYPMNKVQTLVIINSASSWWPDSLLNSTLRSKQNSNPQTKFLMDSNLHLVKTWGLQDESYDIFVFDKQGKTIFAGFGKLKNTQMEQMFSVIEQRL